MSTFALDRLYAIADAHGTSIGLRRDRGAQHWVATVTGAGSASAPTATGAVRALADKLAPRPLALCQREEPHG